MNITELARQLRLNTQDLRDHLPSMGFDIGQKAIKVDDKVAQQIARAWPRFRQQLEEKRRKEMEKERINQAKEQLGGAISIPAFITVRDLAAAMHLPVNTVITTLMKNGVLATMNEKIDFGTAEILGAELGIAVNQLTEDQTENTTNEVNQLKNNLDHEEKKNLAKRPPVVVVMGHVDHGKTKLLDAIRSTNVVDQEAGGITQHIGAYQVVAKNELITFIDTPGHEAFTAMRSRGAKVADIAILLVAADDSIKPQTVEAIKIIEKNHLPMIVAINKIDKPDANIDKVKTDLAQMNYTPEDWGGKTICVPVSAKQKLNIEQLLEMILLVAEMEKETIVANPESPAIGTIIEAHVSKGEGPVATLLVQNGTLKLNDPLVVGGTFYGKVRAMRDWQNKEVLIAAPAMPVKILGFKVAPLVGDIVEVSESGEKVKNIRRSSEPVNIATSSSPEENGDTPVKNIHVILKTDMLGSSEAIVESLEKISGLDVKVKIISRGLGNINESDVTRAEVENAYLIGFNVKPNTQAELLAYEHHVKIHTYKIIYELIDFIKKEIEGMLGKEIIEEKVGKLKILKIFKTEKKGQIVGCKVLEGKAVLGAKIDAYRGTEFVATGKIEMLQAGKQDVKDVMTGQECGIYFQGNPVLAEGDLLDVIKVEEKIKRLSV